MIMATFYYKLITNSLFCNKKRLIIAYILIFIAFLILLFIGRKEIENKIVLLIFMSTCIFGAYKTFKINDFNYLTYNCDLKSYDYYSLKRNKICYNETFNKLLLNKINSNELGIESTKKIDNFLLNFNNEFISKLKEDITFERFNDYFTNSKGKKTTGQLFYVQYRSSLIKIIKDIIIKTNRLEDVSNETISSFMSELTNHKNLNFDSDKGLHYDDKLVFKFLENNNKQKPTIEQENPVSKQIKQIELKRISKTQFYKVLEKTSIDILKVQLTKENQEELKSFVGNLFTTKIKCNFSYNSNITKLNFIDSENIKPFIMAMRYLQDKTMINLFNIDLIRNLDLTIKNDSITSDSNKRISFIKSITYQKLTPKQIKNIDNILLNFQKTHI
ncbi:hypothetical protein EMST110833_01920 [Empedobacter stercoris]